MAVYLPCYCTREDVKSAADILQTADYNAHIDSAIQSAVDDVNRLCKRRFWNAIETHEWDWPNYQMAYPWRLWFDMAELADTTVNVPVVTSGGNVIPNSEIFWGNPRYAPPFTYMELDRSTTATFGQGVTPQRDVAITGTYGYWLQTRSAGTLAATVSSDSATTLVVSNAALVGVGDMITVDSESFLVSDRAFSDTGQAQTGSGCTEALDNDNVLTVGTGADLNVGELLQLDAEVMLATSITGNNVSVIRAYDGSTLATHSNAEVYAARTLTVIRGSFGTTASTHSNSAPVTALLIPPQVKELSIGESLNTIAQKSNAYARALAENSSVVPGIGLPDLRNRVQELYGRKARQRVI